MQERPQLPQDAPTMRLAAKPLTGEHARFALDAHSPMNAVAGAISCLRLASDFAGKRGGDFAFPKTHARLEALLEAMRAGREAFVAAAREGADPDKLAMEEAVAADITECAASLEWLHLYRQTASVIRARVGELLERWSKGDTVGAFSEAEVGGMLREVLGIIAEISHKGERPFKIAFTAQDKGPADYLFTFSMRGPDGSGRVRMPEALRDVVRDLTCNARKYSKPGAAFSARIEETDHDLTVDVEDRGTGILPEDAARLGEEGFRGAEAKLSSSGHGLGLSKANTVAARWGGTLAYKTLPGVGTIFRIRIPKPYRPRSGESDALVPVAK